MYDLDEYGTGIRGFYFDICEIPGPKIKTEDELIRQIAKLSGGSEYGESWFNEYGEVFERFIDKFAYLEDGRASERVVNIMMES